ncbi:MAG: Rieske 2Fe-2S domain-containing protein [Syntrophaceae bacterium]|jgi:cytochrome b6-f complex iron-sulfur subunit|nr:Rieske 2Fe-2S domain-containing protein [Syntrophaceae bacterium]
MVEDTSTAAPLKAPETGALTVPATRRGLLKGLLGALGVFGLGTFLYGVYRFLAPGAGGAEPVEIPVAEISASGTAFFQYGGTPGILLRGDDQTLKAFSLVCTHLACIVTWNAEKKEFYCPCHDGFFDAEGRVVSGPPPSPLERWKVEIKGDKAIIGAA